VLPELVGQRLEDRLGAIGGRAEGPGVRQRPVPREVQADEDGAAPGRLVQDGGELADVGRDPGVPGHGHDDGAPVRWVPSAVMSIRAWQAQQLGTPAEVLTLREAPSPRPGAGQVRVVVRASAVNFADTLMCRGEYQVRPEPPFVPGLEVCGDVLEVGEGVTHVAVGDRVLGGTAVPHGGFATECLMEASKTFAAPAGLDDAA